jgi:hypothetical protein
VRRVLRAAVVDRRIPRNPTFGVALPAMRKRDVPLETDSGLRWDDGAQRGPF